MCTKCNDIDESIARYQRIKAQISDRQATEAADHFLTKLAAEKQALHSEK